MANWKKVLTEADNATYANQSITLAQLDAGLDGESGYGANKILKVNSSGNAIEWATDSSVGAVNDLTDVTITSASSAQVLSYSGSAWVNKSLSNAGIAPKAGDSSQDFAVGDLTLGGNDIKSSAGTVVMTTNASNPDVTFARSVTVDGDLRINGNDIQASDGTTAITMSGADVTIAGDLTVTGKNITTTAEVLQINDNTIVLNADLTATTDVDAGIVVERGGSGDNATFYWDEGDDRWRFGTNDDADLSTSPTYASDVMQVRIDGAAINTSSTEVPIGHLQYHNGELYLRVED